MIVPLLWRSDFLDAAVCGRLVEVTLVTRGQAYSTGSSTAQRTPNIEPKQGKEGVREEVSRDNVNLGAWECLRTEHAAGNQSGEYPSAGTRGEGMAMQGDLHVKDCPGLPCVFVNLRYWGGGLFSLRSHDLAEELLNRGLAVVASDRLQTERDSSQASGCFRSLWRRWRSQRRKKEVGQLTSAIKRFVFLVSWGVR